MHYTTLLAITDGVFELCVAHVDMTSGSLFFG